MTTCRGPSPLNRLSLASGLCPLDRGQMATATFKQLHATSIRHGHTWCWLEPRQAHNTHADPDPRLSGFSG